MNGPASARGGISKKRAPRKAHRRARARVDGAAAAAVHRPGAVSVREIHALQRKRAAANGEDAGRSASAQSDARGQTRGVDGHVFTESDLSAGGEYNALAGKGGDEVHHASKWAITHRLAQGNVRSGGRVEFIRCRGHAAA